VEFNVGDCVRLVQRGTIKVGTVVLTDNTFERVQVVRKNADGTYGVRLSDQIQFPGMEVVTVPARMASPDFIASIEIDGQASGSIA
jgi:hypothetical protein